MERMCAKVNDFGASYRFTQQSGQFPAATDRQVGVAYSPTTSIRELRAQVAHELEYRKQKKLRRKLGNFNKASSFAFSQRSLLKKESPSRHYPEATPLALFPPETALTAASGVSASFDLKRPGKWRE